MCKRLIEDAKSIAARDPAAKSMLEVMFLYPGFHALVNHKIAHWFYVRRLFFIARFVSQMGRFCTGIEIHPGAIIGRGLFIDHGMGVVIGETAEIGDNCTIYHGVTLGGTGKEKGKRHPTIGNNVLIGTGAKILGPFKVGDNSRIAANAVVLSEVEDNTTMTGVPARPVRRGNVRLSPAVELDQIHMPDPVAQELCKLLVRIEKLENSAGMSTGDVPEQNRARPEIEEFCKTDGKGAQRT
ncbi:MAG: serine O-acetyltransferase EpsC [Clostridiales bacterium]|nr:serine O-acetyltransferase EpsC [Clostridiales bacterium]